MKYHVKSMFATYGGDNLITAYQIPDNIDENWVPPSWCGKYIVSVGYGNHPVINFTNVYITKEFPFRTFANATDYVILCMVDKQERIGILSKDTFETMFEAVKDDSPKEEEKVTKTDGVQWLGKEVDAIIVSKKPISHTMKDNKKEIYNDKNVITAEILKSRKAQYLNGWTVPLHAKHVKEVEIPTWLKPYVCQTHVDDSGKVTVYLRRSSLISHDSIIPICSGEYIQRSTIAGDEFEGDTINEIPSNPNQCDMNIPIKDCKYTFSELVSSPDTMILIDPDNASYGICAYVFNPSLSKNSCFVIAVTDSGLYYAADTSVPAKCKSGSHDVSADDRTFYVTAYEALHILMKYRTLLEARRDLERSLLDNRSSLDCVGIVIDMKAWNTRRVRHCSKERNEYKALVDKIYDIITYLKEE